MTWLECRSYLRLSLWRRADFSRLYDINAGNSQTPTVQPSAVRILEAAGYPIYVLPRWLSTRH